ncbi:TspO/MBR-related_protein [Hexamita inflata]|uniref:TspO/MBR-related_protein n=1 Tax=Hexamita inflata TaxID=28002 RepID=A0ABP1GHL5_9EUKA
MFWLKILAGAALIVQFVISYVYRPSDTADNNKSLITPPGVTFALCWAIIYTLQLIQILYVFVKVDEKEKASKVLLLTQTAMSVLNFLWILLFERFKNWVGQMITIILLYLVLLFHLAYTRTLRRGWDILIKVFGGFYAGWVTQAQMLAILVLSNSIDKSIELDLCRALLILSIIFDVVVTFAFKNGYGCIPQAIAFGLSLSSLADRVLYWAAVVGIVVDAVLVVYQVISEIYSWKRQKNSQLFEIAPEKVNENKLVDQQNMYIFAPTTLNKSKDTIAHTL